MGEMRVIGVRVEQPQNQPVLLLRESDGDRYLPIWIGQTEATAIVLEQQGVEPARPLTHDLIKKLADALQVTLKEAFIYRLDSGIFYSELLIEKDTQQIKIDSRTSDAIALALRYDCPIYSTPEIVEKAGIAVGQETGQTESPEKEEVVQQPYSVQELTRMLDEAVRNEEYEKASKIRDLLKEMGK